MSDPKRDESPQNDSDRSTAPQTDKAVGDNRRMGDQDSNRDGGHSKSPGTNEQTEDRKPDPLH